MNHRPCLGLPSFTSPLLHRRTQQRVSVPVRAESITDKPVPWKSTLLGLGISGAIGGTLMDGIHSRVPLQVCEPPK